MQHSALSIAWPPFTKRWLLSLFAFVVAVCMSGFTTSHAAAPIPSLTNWVTDTTNTLTSAQQQQLSQQLQALEQSKGAQLFVLMVATTDGEDIDAYARRVFDQWKVGRQGTDDGVLLVIAKDDRRLRIEVGYGLEGAITDLQSGRIIREQITPYFKQNAYFQGIEAGVTSLSALIQGEDLPSPVSGGAAGSDEDEPYIMLIPIFAFATLMPLFVAPLVTGLFVFLMFWSVPIAVLGGMAAFLLNAAVRAFRGGPRGRGGSRHLTSRRGRQGVFMGPAGWRGGGGRGGGGFGGGGFGGGGGGSSGGGGASGGW